ncbi:MAG: aspartate aminotransferase family protein [Planctomycetota bacterium]|nr:aspartate aminotransferase family protein [Planctomycetota bacterium]
MSLKELPAYARIELDVVGAEGCELLLADGTRVLDLYGGHCVNTLGAGDKGLGAALSRQWNALSFTTNLLDTESRDKYNAALAPLLPLGDWQIFCSNSGAEANENALKLALAATGREGVVCFAGAFHGRTAAAAAVTDPRTPGFPSAPFKVTRNVWGSLEGINESTAACILEPIQSLAGVIAPPAGFLEALRAKCDETGALLIFDEVQTGNGRLGVPFAAQHFGVIPDVITTAKGAASGFPLGLTLAQTEAAERAPSNLFGSTFGGGPLAMVAATETAKRLSQPGFLDGVRAAGAAFAECAGVGPVTAVRGAGLLLGLELCDGVTAKEVRDALLTQGVLVGTCWDPKIVRLSPPLVVTPAHAEQLKGALANLEVSA